MQETDFHMIDSVLIDHELSSIKPVIKSNSFHCVKQNSSNSELYYYKSPIVSFVSPNDVSSGDNFSKITLHKANPSGLNNGFLITRKNCDFTEQSGCPKIIIHQGRNSTNSTTVTGEIAQDCSDFSILRSVSLEIPRTDCKPSAISSFPLQPSNNRHKSTYTLKKQRDLPQFNSLFELPSPSHRHHRCHNEIITQFNLRPPILKQINHQLVDQNFSLNKGVSLQGLAELPYTPFSQKSNPQVSNINISKNSLTEIKNVDIEDMESSFSDLAGISPSSLRQYSANLGKRDTLVTQNVTKKVLHDMHKCLSQQLKVSHNGKPNKQTRLDSNPLYERDEHSMCKSSDSIIKVVTANKSNSKRCIKHFLGLAEQTMIDRTECNNNNAFGMNGGYQSRKNMCKLLVMNGQPMKNSYWKSYTVGVDHCSVRFIKANFTGFNLRKNQKCHSAIDEKEQLMTAKQKRRHGSSCIVLPIQGLLWRMEQCPIEVKTKKPAPVTHTHPASSVSSAESTFDILFDPMDPLNMANVVSTQHSNERMIYTGRIPDFLAQQQCFRFGHLEIGVELLVVIPDADASVISFVLSKVENSVYDCKENSHPIDGPRIANFSSSLPHEIDVPLWFQFQSQRRPPGTLSNKLLANTDLHNNRCKTAKEHNENRSNSLSSCSSNSSSGLNSSTSSSQASKRRIYDTRYSARRLKAAYAEIQLDLDSHSLQNKIKSSTKSLAQLSLTGTSMNVPEDAHLPIPSSDEVTISSLKDKKRCQHLFKGLAQFLLLKSTPGTSSINSIKDLTLSQEDTSRLLIDFEHPGLVFGCPLVDQLESPEHPYVPLILHLLVMSLERHELFHLGLYRRSGRHKSIASFISLLNIIGFSDATLLASLDAWREVNVLTGLIKLFIRRLPEGLFDLNQWKIALSLVDDEPRCLKCAEKLLTNLATANFGENKLSAWRWHTTCFIMAHLCAVIRMESLNSMSAYSMAVCLGPVFFNHWYTSPVTASSSAFTGSLHNGTGSFSPQKSNKLMQILLVNWRTLLSQIGAHDEYYREESSSIFQICRGLERRRGTEPVSYFHPMPIANRRPTTATCNLMEIKNSASSIGSIDDNKLIIEMIHVNLERLIKSANKRIKSRRVSQQS